MTTERKEKERMCDLWLHGIPGLRGSMLEEMINLTNMKYRETKLALVQKVPTPITPINIDKEHRHITLAYFEQKVPLTILVLFKEYPFALMQKNVP